MNAQIILLLGLAACVLVPAASAGAQERDLSPGLRYTAIGNKPVARPVSPEAPAVERPVAGKSGDAIEQESTESRIWNKYKALAAGTAGDEAGATSPAEAAPAATPEKAIRQKTAPSIKIEGPKSTVAELIGRWQDSKAQQKDMRSKSFQVPAHLIEAAPRDGAPAPASPAPKAP